MSSTQETSAGPNELVVTRLLLAPRHLVWQAWSEPELLRQWWSPRPWTTEVRALDLRPGGAFHTFMRGPDGDTSDNPCCFLEVIPQSKVVFTSMLSGDWRPNSPWMPFTASITMSDEGDGTRYVARVKHPDQETKERHEQMGFFDGWNAAIDQLAEVVEEHRVGRGA